MDTVGTIVSWVQEAWNTSTQVAFDPRFWGILFALLVLASLYSLARSLRRLNRQLSSAVSELEDLRSTLKRVEKILERSQANPSPADARDQGILDLPLRERKEKR